MSVISSRMFAAEHVLREEWVALIASTIYGGNNRMVPSECVEVAETTWELAHSERLLFAENCVGEMAAAVH